MWVARLARRRASLARLGAGRESLADGSGPAQLRTGQGMSLPMLEVRGSHGLARQVNVGCLTCGLH